MAVVVEAFIDSGVLDTGHGTSRVSAESGLTSARSEDGATPIPIPPATGTHFSWPLFAWLKCTTGDASTPITNKRISLAAPLPAGVRLWCKAVAVGSYVQPVDVGAPDVAGNGKGPAGFFEVSTTPTVWDATSITATTAAQVSKYAELVIGVDAKCDIGEAVAAALGTVRMTYDGPTAGGTLAYLGNQKVAYLTLPSVGLVNPGDIITPDSEAMTLLLPDTRRWRAVNLRSIPLDANLALTSLVTNVVAGAGITVVVDGGTATISIT